MKCMFSFRMVYSYQVFFSSNTNINRTIHICYSPAGRSILGKTVLSGGADTVAGLSILSDLIA